MSINNKVGRTQMNDIFNVPRSDATPGASAQSVCEEKVDSRWEKTMCCVARVHYVFGGVSVIVCVCYIVSFY